MSFAHSTVTCQSQEDITQYALGSPFCMFYPAVLCITLCWQTAEHGQILVSLLYVPSPASVFYKAIPSSLSDGLNKELLANSQELSGREKVWVRIRQGSICQHGPEEVGQGERPGIGVGESWPCGSTQTSVN